MPKNSQITTLSDARILELAFTDVECAKEMMEKLGSECFVSDLRAAVEANKRIPNDGIGIAIRQVLGKQLNVIVQSNHFKASVEKSSLGSWLPEVKDTNDLIDFVIEMRSGLKQYITRTIIDKAIAKKLPKIAQDLNSIRIAGYIAAKEEKAQLPRLQESSDKANNNFISASQELRSAIHDLKIYIKEEQGPQDAQDLIGNNTSITTDKIEDLKSSLPNTNKYKELLKKLEEKAEAKALAHDIADKCSLELASAYQAVQEIPNNLNEETYKEALKGMLYLGLKTCKDSKISQNQSRENYQQELQAKPDTYQIAHLLQSGKISKKLKAKLLTAINIINEREEELTKEAEAQEQRRQAAQEPIESLESPTPEIGEPSNTEHVLEEKSAIKDPIKISDESPNTSDEDNLSDIQNTEEAPIPLEEPQLPTPAEDKQPEDTAAKQERLADLTQQRKVINREITTSTNIHKALQQVIAGHIDYAQPLKGKKLIKAQEMLKESITSNIEAHQKLLGQIQAKEAIEQEIANHTEPCIQEPNKNISSETKPIDEQKATSEIQKAFRLYQESQSTGPKIAHTDTEEEIPQPTAENNSTENHSNTQKQSFLGRLWHAFKAFIVRHFSSDSTREEEPPIKNDTRPVNDTEFISTNVENMNPINEKESPNIAELNEDDDSSSESP